MLIDEAALADGVPMRLSWHLEHSDRPLLAARTMAAQGRDLRLRLQELDGHLIDEPQVSVQVGDAVIDPGMESDEPELPPSYGRLTDANTPTGEPDE